jgi:hypothetical protein
MTDTEIITSLGLEGGGGAASGMPSTNTHNPFAKSAGASSGHPMSAQTGVQGGTQDFSHLIETVKEEAVKPSETVQSQPETIIEDSSKKENPLNPS